MYAANAEDRASEIAEWIAEEIAVVSAYTSVWRGSSTLEGPPASDVTEDVFSQAARRVLPWPGISECPVPETTDGRIVKSHPLTFPAGCGDLRQPRLRTDFHPLEWTQHIFRYFDGRVVSSLRGQRAVWACFNTAMRQLSRSAGALLHKRSNVQALTKADLKAYIESRETLVSQLGVFGSELPSTAMQWKREGNELQWIVRQMSWLPPWTKAGLAETRKDLRRLGSYVKPTQKSSPCKRRARDEYSRALQGDVLTVGTASDELASPALPLLSDDASAAEGSDVESATSTSTSDLLTDGGYPLDDGPAPMTPGSKAASQAASERETSEDQEDEPQPSTWRSDAPLPWSCLPKAAAGDPFGYGRSPAFWFTLNLAYNHTFDIHRFHKAVALVRGLVPGETCLVASATNTHAARGYRCNWVRDNADIVVFLHALRVEL